MIAASRSGFLTATLVLVLMLAGFTPAAGLGAFAAKAFALFANGWNARGAPAAAHSRWNQRAPGGLSSVPNRGASASISLPHSRQLERPVFASSIR